MYLLKLKLLSGGRFTNYEVSERGIVWYVKTVVSVLFSLHMPFWYGNSDGSITHPNTSALFPIA